MKVYNLTMACGHQVTTEDMAFHWFYCQDCKQKRWVKIIKSNNVESKE